MKEDISKVDGIPITRLKNLCILKPGTKLFKFVPLAMPAKDLSAKPAEPAGERRKSN